MAMNTSGDSFMSSAVSLDNFDVPKSRPNSTPMDELLIVVASECMKLEQELQSKTEFQENLALNKEEDDHEVEETEFQRNLGLNKQEYADDAEEEADQEDEEEEEEASSSKIGKNKSKNSNNQKKQKKINNSENLMMLTGADPPPDLPEKFKSMINELGGTEITLVIQKSLYKSDVNPGNNRLSMPLTQIKADFLKESEKEMIEITVPLMQPSLEIIDVVLVKWRMPKDSGAVSIIYNLKTTWMKVVRANELKEKDVIQVWSFRIQEKLFMALVKVM